MSGRHSGRQDGNIRWRFLLFTLPASEFVKQTGENSAMSAAFNLQKDKEQNAEEWAEAYCNTAHKERARGAAEY